MRARAIANPVGCRSSSSASRTGVVTSTAGYARTRSSPSHASNVQLVCPECGAMTRIGRKILNDGRKVRVCRKCEGVVDK